MTKTKIWKKTGAHTRQSRSLELYQHDLGQLSHYMCLWQCHCRLDVVSWKRRMDLCFQGPACESEVSVCRICFMIVDWCLMARERLPVDCLQRILLPKVGLPQVRLFFEKCRRQGQLWEGWQVHSPNYMKNIYSLFLEHRFGGLSFPFFSVSDEGIALDQSVCQTLKIQCFFWSVPAVTAPLETAPRRIYIYSIHFVRW